jgi:hypothetical protein
MASDSRPGNSTGAPAPTAAGDADQPPSERSFAIVFAVVFLVVAAIRGWRGHADAPYWLVPAAVMLLLGYLWVAPLRPLNRLWWRFGLLLHRLISPIIMALLFFGAVLPVGLLMRLLGKDPLRRKADAAASTYWVDVQPEAAARPERMKDQF